MTDFLILYIPGISDIAIEIVVLPVTGRRIPDTESQKEEITHEFIPDRRKFTFRLIGKPSLAQSPPVY